MTSPANDGSYHADYEQSSHPVPHSSSEKVVVVAEDNDEIRELLTLVLESGGFRVVQVADGSQVLPKVREVKPNLLLLDLAMPNKHGNEVLQEMAADESTRNIPVFVVSAYTNQLHRTPQVKRIIPKPFEIAELLDFVEREVEGSASEV